MQHCSPMNAGRKFSYCQLILPDLSCRRPWVCGLSRGERQDRGERPFLFVEDNPTGPMSMDAFDALGRKDFSFALSAFDKGEGLEARFWRCAATAERAEYIFRTLGVLLIAGLLLLRAFSFAVSAGHAESSTGGGHGIVASGLIAGDRICDPGNGESPRRPMHDRCLLCLVASGSADKFALVLSIAIFVFLPLGEFFAWPSPEDVDRATAARIRSAPARAPPV
jgi:hypothetical protein